ncbi:MAG: phosphate/phosphite/phosphonate ABC transporter substrate-binding protein [Marinobacter sp.]|uniref:phosphate/phosphite/phosphonate ABC transporter substrate-binding protein n=1 Tax=Marinobacter sp. TaxID=50741 RepID=UPI00299CE54D|nr:phosphate/phosphite/phosphonate ABC transporter substrate-binding protein [Marinobacter sp.]MDX1755699.1 phosphate/phosphite/phosphonate ABC transporter substrate-binding protein [Marinobacter sp.]
MQDLAKLCSRLTVSLRCVPRPWALSLGLLAWLLTLPTLPVHAEATFVPTGEVNDAQREQTLVIGRVASDPAKSVPPLADIACYLARQMQAQGISRCQVLLADNNTTMAHWLRDGTVDLVTESPFSATYLKEASDAVPVAIGWRGGVKLYHSVVFVHKDSGLSSLQDLVGETIAFEDAGSTSAYFLPAASLRLNGHRLSPLASVRQSPKPAFTNYVFSLDEANSTAWVHKRLVSAAALSNLDWEDEGIVPPAMKRDLRIIFRTDNVPRSVELVTAQRNDQFRQHLQDALLNAHRDPEGREIIQRFKDLTRFTAIDREAEKMLTDVAELMRRVKHELE